MTLTQLNIAFSDLNLINFIGSDRICIYLTENRNEYNNIRKITKYT